jgi:hypothetical protein
LSIASVEISISDSYKSAKMLRAKKDLQSAKAAQPILVQAPKSKESLRSQENRANGHHAGR